MNSVPTAHVILGIDTGNGEGEAAFQEFDRTRTNKSSAASDKSVSKWHKTYKHNIVLSTLDNSEIIKFNHSFNLEETQDQSLFIFEIVDPNGTFERNFLSTLYGGIENYAEMVDNVLATGKKDISHLLEQTLSLGAQPHFAEKFFLK